MQAGPELQGWKRRAAIAIIKTSRYAGALTAWGLVKLGVAKEIAGRYTEPWGWTRQTLSATELDNFFLLRNHSDAEPHIRDLARKMQRQVSIAKSVFADMQRFGNKTLLSYDRARIQYQLLNPGEWHLPYLFAEELNALPLDLAKKTSTARSARTSYRTFDGAVSKVEDDLILYEKLVGSQPFHASPAEHAAQALEEDYFSANFRSFAQHRSEIPGEAGTSDPAPF